MRYAILLPAVAAVVALIPLLWYLMSGLLQRSAETHMEHSLPVLERLVQPRLSDHPQELQHWFEEVAGNETWRVTLIDADGVVLADSNRSWNQVLEMDNHADRPEVEEAGRRGRGVAMRWSATLREDFIYAAQRVVDADGDVHILRLSEPVAELSDLRQRLAWLLVLATVSALIVVVGASWWLYRTLFRPLALLAAGANRLARGDLEHRIPLPEAEELADLGRSLNRLGERVEEQIGAAEEQHTHLRRVVASMSEGILVTDAFGRAELANESFRRLFGIRGEVAGRTCLELTRQPLLDAALSGVLLKGESDELELELMHEGRRSIAASLSPIGDLSGAVVAARDISDLVRLGEVRRDLVSNVAHELKTPLAAIRGYAETLQDGAVDDPSANRRFLDKILRQCARLQALLDDLLTLSRLERDDDLTLGVPVDLRRIVEEAVETMELVASDRSVRLESDLHDVPRVEGNAEALEKLTLNLLDNAIKYNHVDGSVRVGLESDEEEIRLTVEDTGRGIPNECRPRIFERFYRVDRGRARDDGGTGLGLAIVKHAVQIHDGRIEVSSTPSTGSTFVVRLPLAGAREGARSVGGDG